jgi:hypothetical protein
VGVDKLVGIGKLYVPGGDQSGVSIKYRFYVVSAAGWRGEFVLREFRRFSDGDGYVIELEDGRRGACYIRKMVNRVIATVPPRFSYYFRGSERLTKPKKKPGGTSGKSKRGEAPLKKKSSPSP